MRVFDFFSPIDAVRKISGQKAEKNIGESFDYLDNDFRAVAKLLEEYYPLELLKTAVMNENGNCRKASSSLLPVILQGVLSSLYFTKCGGKKEIKSSDWKRLNALGDDVLRRLGRIIDSKTAVFLESGEKSNEEGELYRSIISSRLIPPLMTKEKLSYCSPLLRSLLTEKENGEVSSDTLWINLDNIASYSLGAVDDLERRFSSYKDDFNRAVQEKGPHFLEKRPEEIYRIITEENGWTERAEKLAGEREGYDMFLLAKLSSLPSTVYEPYSTRVGSLDITAELRKGIWPSLRCPFIRWNSSETYTFVGKYIPYFLTAAPVADRRKAAERDMLSIFFRIGIDTYTYDGNSIDISVLPSFYDADLFGDPGLYDAVKKVREEEKSLKTVYGHKRLIVDPDMESGMERDGSSLTISSSFMARCAVDRNSKHELIRSLLGQLELPGKTEEYRVIDEDELDNSDGPAADDVMDDPVTDDYEYDNSDGTVPELDEDIPPVEYERKSVDIRKEEEKYALTDEIIRKDEEIEKEEEKYEEELDDDIFDDSEEEEKLDEIGEKEDEYYVELDSDDVRPESDESASEEKEEYDGQLDFFDILDEEEEKVLDDELEKEDEEEFKAEEEVEESLDDASSSDSGVKTEEDSSSDNTSDEEKILSDELEKEDEEEFKEEEEAEESLDEDTEELPSSGDGNEVEPSVDDSFVLPAVEEKEAAGAEESSLSDEEEILDDEHPDDEGESLYEETQAGAVQEDLPSSVDDSFVLPVVDDTPVEEANSALPDDIPSAIEEEIPDGGLEKEENAEESLLEDTEELPPSGDGNEVEPAVDDSFVIPVVDETPEEKLSGSVEDSAENTVSVPSEGTAFSEEEDAQEADSSSLPADGEKGLDTSAWLNDFLVSDGTEEDGAAADDPEKPAADEESNQSVEDSFVLPVVEDTPAVEPQEEKSPDTSAWLNDFLALDGTEEDEIEGGSTITENTTEESVDGKNEEEPSEDGEHRVFSMEELEEDNVVLPVMEEEETGIVHDICLKLGSTSSFTSFVKESTGDTLEELTLVIRNCWEKMQNEEKDKIFNIADYSLSVILSHDALRDELRRSELINNAGGVMYARGDESWTAVIIYIDSDFVLRDAVEKHITKESFSPSDWKRVTYIGEQMKRR